VQKLKHRNWVPAPSEALIGDIAQQTAKAPSHDIAQRLQALAEQNRDIHDRDCLNLNPATNVMNPRAEALLGSGLGSRPSLGYPGDKYEMGLEAIQEIEVIAAELAAEVFHADYAEIRVASGALGNLYAFMATCRPGDRIIAFPDSIAGHVTHHQAGAAGLYGLQIHDAPVNADGYTVDVAALAEMARDLSPRLITMGGSLNLFPHPVSAVREIAEEVGAYLLFDAAHLCGMIAGGTWQNPLDQGAHLMSMSTYKSLGGPAGGLIVTNDPTLAARLDRIAFPGLTANFDAAKTAALAMTLLDWRDHGTAYAQAMVATAQGLAEALQARQIPLFAAHKGATTSHQFAIEAAAYGGGQTAAKRLRRANILTSGIGLPLPPVTGDMNGLRIGTPEIVRRGMGLPEIETIADLISRALTAANPETLAADVSAFRRPFQRVHFVNDHD